MLVPFSTHVCDREGKSWAPVWSVARNPAGIRSSRSLADRARLGYSYQTIRRMRVKGLPHIGNSLAPPLPSAHGPPVIWLDWS